MLLTALQAGASGLPFAVVPGLIGSDLLRVRPDYVTIPNPFDPGYLVVAVPAITPDVALIHALRADRTGNLVVPAHGDEPLLAMASRLVVATAEVIEEEPIASIGAGERLISGIYVHALAPAPRGMHPLGCPDRYPADTQHLHRYSEAARAPETFAAYLRAYVLEPQDHAAYLARVQGETVYA